MPSTGAIKFAREDWWKAKDGIASLVTYHYDEIADFKDKLPLDPDWDSYDSLYTNGYLGVYTARVDGAMVGYFILVAMPSLHHKGKMYAVSDVVFLHKDYRKGLDGLLFIKFVETDLKVLGISVVIINTTPHNPFDRVLERLGFNKTEHNFAKYIGD